MAQRVEEIRLSLIDGVSKGLESVSQTVDGVAVALDDLNKGAAESQKSVSSAADTIASLGNESKSTSDEVDEFTKVLQRQVDKLKEQNIEARGGVAALARYKLEQLDQAGASEKQRAAAARLIDELEAQQRSLEELKAQTAAAAQAAKDFERTLLKLSSAKTADEIDRLEREFVALKDGVGLSENQIKRFADEMARARKAAADSEHALRESAAAAEAIKRESALANSEVALFNRALSQQVQRLKEQAVEARGGAVALAQYRLEQLNQAGASQEQRDAAQKLIHELKNQEAALAALKQESADAAANLKEFEKVLERVTAAETADELNALEKEFADLARRASLSEDQVKQFNAALNASREAQQKAAAESTRLIRGIEGIRGAVTGVGAAFVQFNAGLQVAQAGIAAVAGAGRAFNNLIKGASDAQFQLAGLQAALGATPEELAKLDAEARRVSETLGLFTQTDVLNALGDLGRAGLSATQAMEALNPVLNLATGGQVDLAFATEVTVNTLTQFGLSIDQAAKLANGLVTAANSSTTNVNDLGLALSYAATQARAAGNDLETTLEILAALAQTGIQGERAGTALRQVFANISEEGSDFAKSLRNDYGITTQNLVQIIEQLRGSADGGKQALLQLGIEARPAIQGLVQLAVPEFNKLRDSVTLTGTAAEDATAKLTETYNAAAGRLVNILTNLRNELATPILEPLGDALESLAQKVSEFAKTEDLNLLKQAITDFATEAGAQIEQLISNFDFKEASERAVILFQNLQTSLIEFKNTAALAAETLGLVFDTLNVTISSVQVAFNSIALVLAKLLEGYFALLEATAKFTGESEKLVEELGRVKESLRDVANQKFDNLGQAVDRLGKSFGVISVGANRAAASVNSFASATAGAGDKTEKATPAFEELSKVIKDIGTKSDFENAAKKFNEFASKAESSADEVQKLAAELNRARKELNSTGDEVQRVTLYVEQADGSFKTLGDSAGDTGKQATKSFGDIRTEAESAVEVTERLIRAFEGANDAAAVNGAVDQFERMRQAGVLTEDQIKAIETAAKKAQAKFAEAGAEGEDAFQQIEDAADDAKDAVEGIGDAAEESATSLEDVFAELDAAQQRSIDLNEEIQQQIEAQRDRSNELLEKEIELLDRKISMSREELALADMLRQKYQLADQDRIDRYAQLIARQRELNAERQEELRIVSVSGGSAAGGGGSNPNRGQVGQGGAPRDIPNTVPSNAPDDTGTLTPRALARLLAPELRRLGIFGG